MRGSDVGVLGHDDAQLIRNTGVSVSPLGEDTEEDGMTLGELFDILVVPDVLRKSGLVHCRVGFSRLSAWCHRVGTCPGSVGLTIRWR